jgi:hypothetical protein
MIGLRLLRDGAVVREAVFARLPVRIGRGAENDFVLPDPSVSRVHAQVEADGEGRLVLRDLGSVNGVHVGPARVEAEPVGAHLRCRVGLVEIEVEPVSQDATVEVRAEEFGRFEQRRSLGHHLRYLASGVLGWTLAQAMDPSFWSPWQKGRAVALLWAGLRLTTAAGARRAGVPQNDYSVLPPVGGFPGVSKDLEAFLAGVRRTSEGAARAAEEVRVSQEGR